MGNISHFDRLLDETEQSTTAEADADAPDGKWTWRTASKKILLTTGSDYRIYFYQAGSKQPIPLPDGTDHVKFAFYARQ